MDGAPEAFVGVLEGNFDELIVRVAD